MTARPSLQQHLEPAPDVQRLLDESIASIRQSLQDLRFGNVSITVHEGHVVQIDVTEKRRLSPG